MTYPVSGAGYPQQPTNTGTAPHGQPGQYAPAQQQYQQYPQQQYQQGQYPPAQQHTQQQYQQGQHQQYAQGQQYQQGQQYPQQQYPPQQQGQYQQGQYQHAPSGTYTARFVKHTGMLILWQDSTSTTEGSFEEITEAYRSAQQHCLLAGWWSISSVLVLNWYSLIKNAVVYGKVKRKAGR